MIRHAAAVVVALCLCPSLVAAQGTELTINATSASVHKSPSAASPVIGRAPRGTTLEVTREVGDWVKVAWPSASDGVGYVRVNAGSLARGAAPASRTAASAPRSVEPSPRSTSTSAEQQIGSRPPTRTSSAYVAPRHQVGLGLRLGGSTFGVGGSARAWSRGPLGVQFEVSRFSLTDPIDNRVTSTQVSPSALYSFGERVSDYMWLRPYAGAGITFNRSTLSSPVVGLAVSDSTTGFQVFGGGELTVANLPQVAVSAELGYHRFETPFAGFELGGFGLSVAGHWYIK